MSDHWISCDDPLCNAHINLMVQEKCHICARPVALMQTAPAIQTALAIPASHLIVRPNLMMHFNGHIREEFLIAVAWNSALPPLPSASTYNQGCGASLLCENSTLPRCLILGSAAMRNSS